MTGRYGPNSPLWSSLFPAYQRFHALAVRTRDVDPVYPVLKWLIGHEPTERVLWSVLTFVAYYDLGSALTVLAEYPEPAVPRKEFLSLPTGIERRGLRSPAALAKHLAGLVDVAQEHGGFGPWLAKATAGAGDARVAWRCAMDALATPWGNGRWAAYKTAELLAEVAGLDLEPADMGHAHSTGPRVGLGLVALDVPVGNSRPSLRALDLISEYLVSALKAARLPGASMATAETTLCDFHALRVGRYYVGHDIDQMQAQLARGSGPLVERAWAARAAVLPREYLGELGGWDGPDRTRKTLYRDTGRIVERRPR